MSRAEPDHTRSRVRRQPARGRYERASIDAILDAGQVAHVAFVEDGQPYAVPMLYARVGDVVYVHGSTASRTMRALASGSAACLTVSILDGLVLAASVFEHSANYRSVMLFGAFGRVEDRAERLTALHAFTEALLPGRWDEVRPPSDAELKATAILGLPIGEASAKVRSGPPTPEPAADGPRPWTGVIPVLRGWARPEPPADAPDLPLPPSVVRALNQET